MLEETCKAVLEKCISIYENLRNAEAVSENIYGSFPKTVRITRFKTIPGKTRLSDKKENIQCWKYENAELKNVEKIPDRTDFTQNGMFYDVASFSFELKDEKVNINYTFGPRFGRGIEYKIKCEDGQISLYDERHIWVS